MNGLVLEGGGAKGAFQIGAFKAFKEMGIEFDYIVGTSIGAINGAFFSCDKFEEAYDLWYNLNPAMVIDGDKNILDSVFSDDTDMDAFNKIIQYGKELIDKKGIDITPLKNLLYKTINEDELRESGKKYGLVTVSLSDFTPLEIFLDDIPEGKLVDYIIASANLPVFKFEKINGKYFLDGGFYNNLPVDMITNKGLENIYVIRIQGVGITRNAKDRDENITIIQPSENTGRVLEFSKSRARNNILLGYYDTMRVLKKLKGEYFYIDRDLEENFYFDYILSLDIAMYNEICGMLEYENVPYYRGIFEIIIPEIAKILNLDISNSYPEIILGMYEEIGKSIGIERFKIYSESEFMNLVEEQFSKGNITEKMFELLPKKYFGIEKLSSKYSMYKLHRIFKGFIAP